MDVNNIIISVMFVFAVCGGIDYIYSAEHDALHFFCNEKDKGQHRESNRLDSDLKPTYNFIS